MPIDIDSALGSLPAALALRARRTELLAANLANADTPHYKARDFDFRAAMDQASQGRVVLAATEPGHIQPSAGGIDPEVHYRVPLQPSLDGNTVDLPVEQAKFAENALRYQATLTFLNGRIKGLLTAIKGE